MARSRRWRLHETGVRAVDAAVKSPRGCERTRRYQNAGQGPGGLPRLQEPRWEEERPSSGARDIQAAYRASRATLRRQSHEKATKRLERDSNERHERSKQLQQLRGELERQASPAELRLSMLRSMPKEEKSA